MGTVQPSCLTEDAFNSLRELLAQLLARRACVWSAMGDPRACVDDIEMAIKLQPDVSHFYLTKGVFDPARAPPPPEPS